MKTPRYLICDYFVMLQAVIAIVGFFLDVVISIQLVFL